MNRKLPVKYRVSALVVDRKRIDRAVCDDARVCVLEHVEGAISQDGLIQIYVEDVMEKP